MRLNATMDYGPVDPGTVTVTGPRRMKASDGHDYVVKMFNDGSKSRFNEYVATNIAQWAGLPVAEPAVVYIDDKFIDQTPDLQEAQIQSGPYYATKFYDNAYDMRSAVGIRPRPPVIINLEEVPAFVVFDVFVHNTDRNDGNTLLVPSNGGRAGYRYLLIDHGRCFGGSDWDAGTASRMLYKVADVPWQIDAIVGEDTLRSPINRMVRLDQAGMDRAKDGLPGEWSISDSDYAALKSAMSSRDPSKILNVIMSSKAYITRRPNNLDRWRS